ncbi:HdeD family acid-resistance protein [Natronococcus wangiae]|uniref:HdeD family acid-resistance protein n=1 Tax=Natronococcus wangiae TaxID=3068275 RepID=UPI00273CF509|nr:HdeD family acid-resistance protein [Natronococcus sp. AD5]
MSTTTSEAGTESLRRGWRTLALAGGVLVLLGLLAMLLPIATGVAITYLVGALLVVGGIVHAGHAVTARGWRGSLWQLTLAIVSVVAGILLLVNPVLGLLSLTILVIAYLLVDGVAELGMSLRMGGEPGRGWIAASGVTSLVLAGLLWAGFPADAAWAIGLLVGISLVVTGLSMVAVAYDGRRTAEDATPSATEPRGA